MKNVNFNSSINMIVFLGLLGVLAVGFQNCGEDSLVAVSSSSESESENENQETNLDKQAFYAGDAFDINLIPYSLDSYFEQNIRSNYAERSGFKAIAVAENGMGVEGGGDSFSDQQSVNTAMLERCQMQSGNRPCALFAEGNTIKYDENDFYKNHVMAVQVVNTFDASKVPGIHPGQKSSFAGPNYAGRSNPFKALAIGLDGTASPGWSNFSQVEANRRAIEFCEVSLKDLPCAVYAEGDQVVFDFVNFTLSPRLLKFGPIAFNAGEVPFVTDSTRATNMQRVVEELAGGRHAVVLLSRYGHYWNGYSDNPIDQSDIDAAKASCETNIPADSTYECFVYSIDSTVVITRDEFNMASFL